MTLKMMILFCSIFSDKHGLKVVAREKLEYFTIISDFKQLSVIVEELARDIKQVVVSYGFIG